MYLLDTDTLAFFSKGQFGLDRKTEQVGFENCLLSEITIAELAFGAENSEYREANLRQLQAIRETFTLLPISEGLFIYGRIKAKLRRKGQIIGSNDMFIAATALAYDLTLVSNNTKDFSRIERLGIYDLRLENWTLPEFNIYAKSA